MLLLLLISHFGLVRPVRLHRWQPTRLPCPWGSLGENTGVGCHFLLQCMKVKSESEVAQLCPTLRDPMDCSLPGSSVHGIFQARVLEWVAIEATIIVVSNFVSYYYVYYQDNRCHVYSNLKIHSIIQVFPIYSNNDCHYLPPF